MPRTQKIPGKFPAMFRGQTFGPGLAVVPDDFPSESEFQTTLDNAERSNMNMPLLVSDASAARATAGEGDALSSTAASLGGDPNEPDRTELEKQLAKEEREAEKARREEEQNAEKLRREEEKQAEKKAKEDEKAAAEALRKQEQEQKKADAAAKKKTARGR